MDAVHAAAIVLAALEVTPAAPQDVTGVVANSREFRALATRSVHRSSSPLTRYLIEAMDPARVTRWQSLLDIDVRLHGAYRPIVAGQAGYPRRLAQVWDAPPVLFARGVPLRDPVKAVAIIGSRQTTPEVLVATSTLAAGIAEAGINVVSGLALGIDGAAHRGAITRGQTTAVLGTGIQNIFPAEHAELANRVAENGTILSEFPPYAPATGTSFLRRNGTIAALSDLLIVMDAASRSGSRQAVTRALDYGRPVLMWHETLSQESWALELVTTGQARFFTDLDDVFSELQLAHL